jgi:hypothetical protein
MKPIVTCADWFQASHTVCCTQPASFLTEVPVSCSCLFFKARHCVHGAARGWYWREGSLNQQCHLQMAVKNCSPLRVLRHPKLRMPSRRRARVRFLAVSGPSSIRKLSTVYLSATIVWSASLTSDVPLDACRSSVHLMINSSLAHCTLISWFCMQWGSTGFRVSCKLRVRIQAQ